MSRRSSQKQFDKSGEVPPPAQREIRCPFCSRRFSGGLGKLAEQIFAHVDATHPEHAIPLADVHAFVFEAMSRGVSVLRWEDE
jgi:hypothetical protein